MSNPIITNVDIGSPMIEVWGKRAGVLRNAAGTTQTFLPGTLLALSTSDQKMHPYDPAGINGLNIPKYVLTSPIVALLTSDNQIEAVTAGKVDQNRLVIHPAVVPTAAQLDQLMDRPFVLLDVKQLGKVDNPQP